MAPFFYVIFFLLVFLRRKHYKKHSLTKKQPLYLVITHKETVGTWITVLLFFLSLFFFYDCQIYFRNM